MYEVKPKLRKAIGKVAVHLPTVRYDGCIEFGTEAIGPAIEAILQADPLKLPILRPYKKPGGQEIRLVTQLGIAPTSYGPYLSWWIDDDGVLIEEEGLVVAVLNNVIPSDYSFLKILYDHQGNFIEIRDGNVVYDVAGNRVGIRETP